MRPVVPSTSILTPDRASSGLVSGHGPEPFDLTGRPHVVLVVESLFRVVRGPSKYVGTQGLSSARILRLLPPPTAPPGRRVVRVTRYPWRTKDTGITDRDAVTSGDTDFLLGPFPRLSHRNLKFQTDGGPGKPKDTGSWSFFSSTVEQPQLTGTGRPPPSRRRRVTPDPLCARLTSPGQVHGEHEEPIHLVLTCSFHRDRVLPGHDPGLVRPLSTPLTSDPPPSPSTIHDECRGLLEVTRPRHQTGSSGQGSRDTRRERSTHPFTYCVVSPQYVSTYLFPEGRVTLLTSVDYELTGLGGLRWSRKHGCSPTRTPRGPVPESVRRHVPGSVKVGSL